MAVSGVDLDINLKIGTDQLNQLNDQIQTSLNRGLAGAASTAAGGLGKVEDKFDDIADSAKRAAVAAEGMFTLDKINNVKGAIGDLGDFVGLLGNDFLGLSKTQQEAVESTLALTEKGIGLGAVFGPLGAVVGGAAGAVLGFMKAEDEAAKEFAQKQAEMAKQAAETAKQVQQLTEENEALAKSFGEASAQSVPEIIGHMRDLEDQIKDVSKELNTAGPLWDQYLERFNLLALGQTQDAAKAAELLQGQIAVGLSAANEALFGPTKKSKSALREELADLTDPKNTMSIAALQKELGALDVKIRDFGDQTGLSLSGSFTEKWAKDAGELNAKLEIALARKKEIEGELKSGPTRSPTKEVEATVEAYTGGLMVIEAYGDALLYVRDGYEEIIRKRGDIEDLIGLNDRLANSRDMGDGLIEFMEADSKATDEATRATDDLIEAIGKLPPLIDSIGDSTETIDPLRAKIQEIFDIVTVEGSNADMAMAGLALGFYNVGDAAASALGGVTSDALNNLFDSLAANEVRLESFREGFLRRVGESLRATGSELIGDGVANELKAAAMAFIPGLQGNAAGLAAVGAVEIATGAAMGGVGIGIGRKVGPAPNPGARGTGADGGPAVSALDNASSGTQDKGTVNITINNGVPQTERGAQEQALMLAGMLGKRPRRGPAS